MADVDLHALFEDAVRGEPLLPDFLPDAVRAGQRRRRARATFVCGAAVVVVLAIVLGGWGVRATRSSTSTTVSPAVRDRLLSIADSVARSCGGSAKHVQVAQSTRAVANRVTSGAVVSGTGAVWVVLITGGPFLCPHPEPPGAHDVPATEVLQILDASTFEVTDWGIGDQQSIAGLGPIDSLR